MTGGGSRVRIGGCEGCQQRDQSLHGLQYRGAQHLRPRGESVRGGNIPAPRRSCQAVGGA